MSSPIVATDLVLTEPFCTVASFKAHPTYLDLGNLRSGSSVPADQNAELFNILLMASEQVEDFCSQPIQAHVAVDYERLWVNRRGRLIHHAEDNPVRTVLSYSYTSIIGQATSVASPLCVIEDNRQISVSLAGAAGSWTGSLQFGPPTSAELDTTWTYVAGYANATLLNSPTQGATSIQVTNPTGIFAGDVLRIWEPGKEESVVVAPSWAGQNTNPYTSATIPLVSGLVNAHAAGAGVTGFASNVMLATIYFAVDGLQRYGTSSASWPGASTRASIGKANPKMTSPWLTKAQDMLRTYRRVR